MTNTASLSNTTSFAIELHDFIREIDAARWRNEMQAALRNRLDGIEQQLGQVMDTVRTARETSAEHSALYSGLRDLASVLRDHAPDGSLTARAARRQWRQLRSRLLPAYEVLASRLRAEEVAVPSIRPTNTARIILHVSAMFLVMFLLQLPLSGWGLVAIAGVSAAFAWILEVLRPSRPRLNAALMAFFRRVAHPFEAHRVNSATWYTTALLGLSLLFIVPDLNASLIAGAAVVVLGIGDPMAGLVGRRWGRIQLINRRTLEGTIAFIITSFAMVFLFALLAHPSIGVIASLIIAGTMAVAGGVAELLSRRLDDNLTIPVCAAASAWLALTLLG